MTFLFSVTFFAMLQTIGTLYLRNNSWKPESILSFNMGWRILVFYPESEARDTFTNIRQPMLKLKAHSGFHELFRL